MSRFRWLLVAALCVGVFSFAAACNDSDDDDGDGGDEPQATATAGDGGDGGDDGGAGGDGGGFSEALERYNDATFKVTYSISGGAVDASEFTISKDAEGRTRIDITAEGDESSIISDAEATYICSSSEQVCFKSEGAVGALANPFVAIVAGVEALGAISDQLDRSERQIAGRDADCYNTEGVAGAEGGEVCWDENGVLLYASVAGDDTVLEATAVSDEVSDTDFTPPYDVQEIPGIPGG
ncbi:MAG: hypothetical protein WEC75_02070 [Dehalococcoidia bacterium]